MAWDLWLDPKTRDIQPGIVTSTNEIIQRLLTRLQRELGEWFLNTSAGLPWYGDAGGKLPGGDGILGAKMYSKTAVDLLIRREVLRTKGVSRILKLHTFFPAGSRSYTISMEIITDNGEIATLNFQGDQ